MGFFKTITGYLGVDIGSTSIKVVELKKENHKVKLVTYGFSENLKVLDKDWQNDVGRVAKILNKVCDDAGATSRNAVAALPTFSVFSSVLNLSNVSKKDMASAVHWEAKKVIPLPLEEMILDWKKIEEPNKDKKNKNNMRDNMRVLLTGAPKTLVKKYVDVFKEAQINLLSLETETFSLIRSLLGNDRSTIMIVEFGANTTDVSIIDNSIPVLNRSIDVGGNTITKAISRHLNMGVERAEQFKYDLGVSSMDSQDSEVPKSVVETISPIVNEIKYAVNLFQSKHNKKTEKIILSGGSSLLPNLANYLSSVLDMKVIIGDAWARVDCPPELEPLLYEIGPRMAVAIGLAMREIE